MALPEVTMKSSIGIQARARVQLPVPSPMSSGEGTKEPPILTARQLISRLGDVTTMSPSWPANFALGLGFCRLCRRHRCLRLLLLLCHDGLTERRAIDKEASLMMILSHIVRGRALLHSPSE